MRALLIVLLALAVGVAVAHVALNDPGYVLITLKPWSVEMSLITFLTVLAVVIAVVYMLLRLLAGLGRAPRNLRQWRQRQLQARAHKAQATGLIHLANAEWAKAEKQLTAYLPNTDQSIINLIGAARAAQGSEAIDRRDQYLRQARPADDSQRYALALTQADLQMKAGDPQAALATLSRVRERAPRNPRALALTVKVYEAMREWSGLLDTVPEARRLRALAPPDCDRLEHNAARELIVEAAPDNLSSAWHSLRRELRDLSPVIDAYAERLIATDHHDEAEETLRKAIDREWRPELVRRYGQVRTGDTVKPLRVAERWANAHGDDPVLMLTLAQFSLANQLWGKARAALEACIENGGSVEAYRELGHLLEQLDERDQALDTYRKGLDEVSAKTGSNQPPKLYSVKS